MKDQIGVQVDLFIPQRRYGRFAGVQCRGMAHRAADVSKQLPASDDGVGIVYGCRRCEKAHEHRKSHDITGNLGRVGRPKIRLTFRRRVETAGRCFVALVRKEITRHTLFDVVGFAGEYLERLILGFPSEAGDGAVVAAGIWTACQSVCPAANTEVLLSGAIRRQIGKNRIVIDRFDQARAE